MNMNKHVVLTVEDLRNSRRFYAAFGLILGFLLCASVVVASAEPEVIDPRMEQACHWPKRHGQAMMVAVIDGKIHCWEMGR
jgi:hypothetical protein